MSVNLFTNNHKVSNEKSRENYDKTFGNKCAFHGTRNGVLKLNGNWLCESCREIENRKVIK